MKNQRHRRLCVNLSSPPIASTRLKLRSAGRHHLVASLVSSSCRLPLARKQAYSLASEGKVDSIFTSIFRFVTNLFLSVAMFIPIGFPGRPALAQQANTHTNPIFFTIKLITPGAAASGFIVGNKDEIYSVATTAHSVEHISHNEEIIAVTHDGVEHAARILQIWKDIDLAIVAFASGNSYRPGQLGYSPVKRETLQLTGYKENSRLIISLGCPVVTEGSNTEARPGGYLIAYRCNTTSGMSGSPLTNSYSEIVGMHGQADMYHDLLGGGAWKSGSSLGVPASLIGDRLGIAQNVDQKKRQLHTADDYYLSSTYKASIGHGIGALRDINAAIEGSRSKSIEHLEHRIYLYIMLGMYEEAGKDIYLIASSFSEAYLGEWLISLLAYHATKDVESVQDLGKQTNKLPTGSFRRVTGFYWAYAGAYKLGLDSQASEFKQLFCNASNAIGYPHEDCT